jgi:hypothetical protein
VVGRGKGLRQTEESWPGRWSKPTWWEIVDEPAVNDHGRCRGRVRERASGVVEDELEWLMVVDVVGKEKATATAMRVFEVGADTRCRQ